MPDFPCPSCGKPMAQGYLVSESLLGGAKWMQEKTRLAVGGNQSSLRTVGGTCTWPAFDAGLVAS